MKWFISLCVCVSSCTVSYFMYCHWGKNPCDSSSFPTWHFLSPPLRRADHISFLLGDCSRLFQSLIRIQHVHKLDRDVSGGDEKTHHTRFVSSSFLSQFPLERFQLMWRVAQSKLECLSGVFKEAKKTTDGWRRCGSGWILSINLLFYKLDDTPRWESHFLLVS